MHKVLISIPDQLAARMKVAIPQRQRSKVIAQLIEEEVEKRERALYECALAVEQDSALNREMEEWDVTLEDGVSDESW
jgi:metal-responsive CopG/Arc/MetJ family transcriptional regulator